MASIINVRLNRGDASPWGFRLQGGKDFGTPLLIQKVNGNSLAEKAGLQVGDAVIRVNGTEVFNLRHKDAQDIIVRGGNNIEVSVQRGGNATWKPAITPVGSVPAPNAHIPSKPSPVTQVSLAANQPKAPPPTIGSAHNLTPRPFSNPQLNGDPVKSIVNKQYNSPVNMYSEETIAETLSAQAEVLAGGVLGVNFKKNEKGYNAEKSEVFKMVQEAEREPKSPEPAETDQGGIVVPPPVIGLRHVTAPESKPSAPGTPNATGPAAGQNLCAECERLIVGVFVRIKDMNLHVECFKCATCGSSLKNVGYYNINKKLYCDIHAKMVARQNPPSANLEPVTVPPGVRAPAGTISAALSSVPSAGPHSPSTIAPVPFHAPRLGPSHVAPPKSIFQHSAPSVPASGPKPFGSVAAPAPAPAPPTYTPPAPPAAPTAAPFYTKQQPGAGGPGNKGATFGGVTAPRRGRGTLNPSVAPGARVPLCGSCNKQIRGPFITALGKIWCPEHFMCANAQCRRPLQDIGFVEENTGLYCEYCFEQFLAPSCSKCNSKIKGDCLNAIGKHFHPECFSCAYCGKLFGNNPFYLEDALPYCENDWNELFTTKCFSCGFPIEAGDRWVEALSNNYHSQCFNCTMCKKNLEGQSFYAKGGRPFCKNHAR